MSINEAKMIIDEYGLSSNEDSFEIVLEVINKFGSAKNVLLEGLKPEYKYLKKLSKLLAMLDQKPSYDLEAEKIHELMYAIYKVVSDDSKSRGEDFMQLMKRINIKKTFHPTDKEVWVMNYIGGRKLVSNITYEEPNQLVRRIVEAIKKYNQLPEASKNLQIENKAFSDLKILNK